jgi:hypothetical protein
MRERHTHSDVLHTYSGSQTFIKGSSPCTGSTVGWSGWVAGYTGYSSTIEDQCGRTTENPCKHVTIRECVPNPANWSMSLVTPNGFTGVWTGLRPDRWTQCRTALSSLADPADDGGDMYDLYMSALPSIKQKMDESFANFAIDAPKLKSVPGLVRKLGDVPKILRAIARKSTNLRRARNARELARLIAKSNLTFQFGLVPLLEEVQSMYKIARSVCKEVNTLKARADKVHTIHRRSNGYCNSVSGDTAVQSGPYITCNGTTASSWYSHSERSVEGDVRCLKIRYKYRMPEFPDWFTKTLGTMDALGLNFNPNIIWDAARYSFVVDWFIKVSPWLRQFQRPLLSPGVTVYSCIHSRKLTVRDRSEIKSSDGFAPWVCMDRVTKTYERVRGTPPMSSLRTAMDMNWFKVHIGLSLLLK